MLVEENKALVRRFFDEAWVKRNPTAVDVFMAAGYVEHAGIPGSQSSGRDGGNRRTTCNLMQSSATPD